MMKLLMKALSILVVSLLTASYVLADEKAESIAHGKTKFATCAACHGQDGKGLQLGPNMLMAPAYKGSTVVDGDPELFALILMKGIKKEGTKYVGVMTGLEAVLNDKDMAGVMTYVRNDFSDKKDLITENQIKEWRAKYKDRKEQVTRQEIEDFLKKTEDKSDEQDKVE